MELIPYESRHMIQVSRIQGESDKYSNFNWQNYNGNSILAHKTIVHNDEIIGAGFLEVVPEAILILEPTMDRELKGEALDLVLREAKRHLCINKFRGMHAFTYNDPEFSKVLVHRYHFVDAGTAFYLGL